MVVKVYELKEIPSRRQRASDKELEPYFEALKSGKGAGDGVAYATRDEAAKAALRLTVRARRLSAGSNLPYPGQRVWQIPGGKWYWALIPSSRTKKAR